VTSQHALHALPQEQVRALWDFADPGASARRFAAAADDLTLPAAHRDELRTQQARALGLAGDRASAEALLNGLDSVDDVVHVRVLLERGRILNSAGLPRAAVPLFRQAADLAEHVRSTHLAVDALHMLAIADEGHEEGWSRDALAVVASAEDPETRRWATSLHNNLGWHLHDAGRLDEALVEFRLAHVASQETGTTEQEQIARWAVARCLRSLGRTDEALELQRELLTERPDDEDVRSEIAALEGNGPTAP
jgi:tetratricopeptide (TPR) repeat protein